jgi:hypothetical protein
MSPGAGEEWRLRHSELSAGCSDEALGETFDGRTIYTAITLSEAERLSTLLSLILLFIFSYNLLKYAWQKHVERKVRKERASERAQEWLEIEKRRQKQIRFEKCLREVKRPRIERVRAEIFAHTTKNTEEHNAKDIIPSQKSEFDDAH